MKLILDATQAELEAKGPALLKSLAEKLGVDLSVLEKSDEEEGVVLKPKALRELHARERVLVQNQYEAMLAEIAQVLG